MSASVIAAGLSDGERRALVDAEDGRLPQYYRDRRVDGTRCRIMLPTIRSLERLALVGPYPNDLTPLGLAVREALTQADRA